jgi:thioesterase domain-containing protein
LANTGIFIINNGNQLAPIGVAGEICIGGDGLARGYLNRTELTSEKFIQNPYNPGHLMYKTGDSGRWLANGNIEYFARIDDQVKISGYRIELGEIESVMLNSGLVKQGVIAAKNDADGNKRLVGYAVQNGSFNKDAVVAYLASKLPAYMVPALWVELESLPLTPNGKIDRKALPQPQAGAGLSSRYEAPKDEAEQTIAGIWQHVMGIQQVGTHDNFFQLGGHSLMGLKIIALVEKITGKQLPVSTLFEHPTVEKFAKLIKSNVQVSKLKSLVSIKSGEAGIKPLYIVSGINGTAFAFVGFAKMLAPHQPVYILQEPQEIGGMDEFPGKVEEIAAVYIAQMMEKDPDGPYALAGHCFGGIIAFEMAKQLERAGKEVRLLALLDTVIYKTEEHKHGWQKAMYTITGGAKKVFQKSYKNITLLLRDRKLAYKYRKEAFLRFMNNMRNKISPIAAEAEKYEFSEKVTQLYKEARENYHITPYGRHVVLYRAKMASFNWDDDKYFEWKQYTKSLEICEVDGDHLTILSSKSFADSVQQNLNRYLHNNQPADVKANEETNIFANA